MADRFLIAPYSNESGLDTSVKPWLIPDQAFSQLNNAYVFRGRVRKRFGSIYMGTDQRTSRLRVNVGLTPGPVNIPNTGLVKIAIGQMFSVGTTLFYVYQLGAGVATYTTNPLITASINSVAVPNTITIAGAAPGVAIYWYPALPVMGLLTYERDTVSNEQVIGFDTQFAYQYLTTGWERISGEVTLNAATWTGDDSQFFWATTWVGVNAFDKVFFVTNFNELEPNFMRFLFNGQWDNFRPQITATPDYVNSARIIVPFKNRLVLFNTWEGINIATAQNYPFRARWSAANQSPLPSNPNAWRQDIPGNGNALDAPISEAIITVEFIKDRLIVYFERSTWEFVYTGNQAYPFVWQQINTELGAESTFSVVPFDQVALGVGNVGIVACNAVNVQRIDSRIPDKVFEIHNANSGVERVYGVRDYFVEMVYWSFPEEDGNADFPYPTRVLVYNYRTQTWAINDDSITVFGYFQPTDSVTWNSVTVTWDDVVPWDGAPNQSLFRQVIAGNQEGYTFIIDADAPTNASVLQITNLVELLPNTNIFVLTVINHNLREAQYIYISGITGTGNLTTLNNKIYEIINVPDKNSIQIISDPVSTPITGTYSGGGLISRVSNIQIRTKEYNFYANDGRNAVINKIDFLVDRQGFILEDGTNNGSSIQVNYFASTSLSNLLTDSAQTGSLQGTGTLDMFAYNNLYPYEQTASRVWHPVYVQADGEVLAFQLEFNDAQMRNVTIRGSDFALHAICIYARPSNNNFQ